MRTKSNAALRSIAIFCCCAVLLASTVHLIHVHHSISGNHKHGKLELNVARSLCLFSVKGASCAIYFPPQPTTLILFRLHDEAEAINTFTPLIQQPERAPPTF
jgi:hypothetical protein